MLAADEAASRPEDKSYLLRQERDDLSADSVQPLGNLRLHTHTTHVFWSTKTLKQKLDR